MVSDPECVPRTCFIFARSVRANRDLFFLFLQWIHSHPYEFEQSAFGSFLLSGQSLLLHDRPPGLARALHAVTWDRVEYPPRHFVEQNRYWTGSADRILLYHRSACPL